LREGHGVVDGRDGNVAAVEHGCPGLVGVYPGPGVEAAEGGLAGRGLADGAGAEAGSFDGLVLCGLCGGFLRKGRVIAGPALPL
jgi:hypothetical protein